MALTFKQIEDEVRRLAAKSPDFVYKASPNGGCFYNPIEVEGEQFGACIFGQAFTNLGEPVDDGFEGVNSSGVLEELGMVRQYSKEYNWSRHVQSLQDEGIPWAEAVREGDERFPLS